MPGSRSPCLLAALSAVTLATGCMAPNPTRPSAAAPARLLSETEQRLVRDVESFVGQAMAQLPAVPSLSVAVARSDGPILVRGFGRADLEGGVPADADTRYYIASSTKSFVGLAMALLDARGAIDLDWTLAALAPDIAFAPGVRANEVTLRHLLSHTHGLTGEAITFRLAYSGEHDPATLWRLLGRLEANERAPLGTFSYGNLGYNVATLLIERRLGRTWQEIVEREVLRPAGLDQTLTRGLEAARARAAFAAPYDSLAPGGPARLYLVKQDDTMQSAGGMYSSATDMARWLQLNLAAARGGRTAIPSAVVAATHRPVATMDERFEMFRRSGYGLGWYSGPWGSETLLHSFGGFTGARAHVSFMPGRDIGVAVLVNDEGAGFILADVVAAFVYDWFGEGPEAARRAGLERLDRIVAQAAQRAGRIAAERTRRAARAWRLTLPRQAYAGRYCSPDYGTVAIAADGEALVMTAGRLRAVAEPFDAEDAIRVEPVPGSGTVLRFGVVGGRVERLQALGGEFRRCG